MGVGCACSKRHIVYLRQQLLKYNFKLQNNKFQSSLWRKDHAVKPMKYIR